MGLSGWQSSKQQYITAKDGAVSGAGVCNKYQACLAVKSTGIRAYVVQTYITRH